MGILSVSCYLGILISVGLFTICFSFNWFRMAREQRRSVLYFVHNPENRCTLVGGCMQKVAFEIEFQH